MEHASYEYNLERTRVVTERDHANERAQQAEERTLRAEQRAAVRYGPLHASIQKRIRKAEERAEKAEIAAARAQELLEQLQAVSEPVQQALFEQTQDENARIMHIWNATARRNAGLAKAGRRQSGVPQRVQDKWKENGKATRRKH